MKLGRILCVALGVASVGVVGVSSPAVVLADPVELTGCTVTTPGDGFVYHTCTSSGTLTVVSGGAVSYVLVGGGGGGGDGVGGGGGGGGEVLSGSFTMSTSLTFMVGAGGTGGTGGGVGTAGGDSTFNGVTANGGGRGGSQFTTGGGAGGNGGGGGYTGGGGVGDQYNGGAASSSENGGGGGGSAAAGASGGASGSADGGNGGGGITWNGTTYGGGGGGGSRADVGGTPTGGTGGSGGGGAGSTGIGAPVAGVAGRGGGGGGGGYSGSARTGGAAGGSGTLVVRYAVESASTTTTSPATTTSTTIPPSVGSCADRVPWAALAGSTVSSAHDNGAIAVQPSNWSFAVAPVGAGGATLAATSTATAVGTGAAGVAAFLLASAGTCAALDLQIGGVSIGGFIDAVLGDTLSLPSVTPTYAINVDDPVSCAGFTSFFPSTNIAGWGMCRPVFLPATVTGTGLGWWSNFNEQSRSGVSNGGAYVAPRAYDFPGNEAELADYRDGIMPLADYVEYGCERNASSTNCQSNTWPHATKPILLRFRCGDMSPVTSPATAVSVGGACGQPPGQFYGLTGVSGSESWRGFFNLWPEVNESGWQRRWVVDVRCRVATGTTQNWIRVESAVFQDVTPDVRVPAPKCATGELPTAFTISKVPTGITCGASYLRCTDFYTPGGGYQSGNNYFQVYEWTAPSTWTNSATAPAYTTCVTAGGSCASPSVISGTCTYGGVAVSGGCDPATQTAGTTVVQTSPTLPELAPTTGDLVDQSDPPLADPVVDPPDGGGGVNVTVNIPIDEGEGECSGRAGCIAVTDIGGGDEDECWVDGWGWFNPAEWVLRPVKCAMVWAFVPDDPGAWVDEQGELLGDQAPFSYVTAGFDILDTATDPSSTRSACLGSVSLPGGSAAAQCLNVSAQAEMVEDNALITTLLWWCVVGFMVLTFVLSTLAMLT